MLVMESRFTTGSGVYVFGALTALRPIPWKLIESVLGTSLRWLDTTPTSRIMTHVTPELSRLYVFAPPFQTRTARVSPSYPKSENLDLFFQCVVRSRSRLLGRCNLWEKGKILSPDDLSLVLPRSYSTTQRQPQRGLNTQSIPVSYFLKCSLKRYSESRTIILGPLLMVFMYFGPYFSAAPEGPSRHF
ncbi:hypothetical protein EI94DRAFT_1255025 [Lactarius quietus]|nr:hypothetical protein EI94DRAFT_1255025 [Lactarius quietus]